MNRTPHITRRRARRLRSGVALLVAAGALVPHLAGAPAASASTSQGALIEDDVALTADPGVEISRFREIGATTIRHVVYWKDIAPDGNANRAPRFNATNPAAYPTANWTVLDTIVIQAKKQGVKLDLDVGGPPPNWAQGAGVPRDAIASRYGWRPNATAYGQFVQALAERYDGRYKVDGATLPRVSIWSLWNEPNFGQDLGPQAMGATTRFGGYLVAPGYYRSLLRTGYGALQKYAKGSTILMGEFAGEGHSSPVTRTLKQGLPGIDGISSPVPFIQTLYCVDAKNRHLSGEVARMAGCPTTAAQARAFRASNPALFDATAVSMHPYASTFPPNPTAKINPQWIIMPVIGRLPRLLSTVTGDWGQRRSFSIWSTEYGFITSPPQVRNQGYPSPATAATYLNESEYLSYRNPQLATFAQYLLDDPVKILNHGLFASGLFTSVGKPKPALDAYRLPLWMPSQTVRRGARVEVWGGARPANFGDGARKVQIQERLGGRWKTLATETAARGTGYFDAHLAFASTGSVRLAYTYPADEGFLPPGIAGTTVYSRTIAVKVA